MTARDGIRGLLFRTLPGRAIVIGVAIKLAVIVVRAITGGRIPAFLSVIETVGGLAVAVGLAYFIFRLLVVAKRRLLWRVRRKLVVLYLFVGVVPALLLAAFSLLVGLLLFYHLSSYLVQSRLRALGEQARFLAQTTAIEIQRNGGRDAAAILARRMASVAGEHPDASIAIVPADRTCDSPSRVSDARLQTSDVTTAGAWSHVPPPRSIPGWITCAGFSGVLAYEHPRPNPNDVDMHLLVRGVAFPDGAHPSFVVVADLLVNDAIRQQLRHDTGVELKTIFAGDPDVHALKGLPGPELAAPPTAANGFLSNLVLVIGFVDWATGEVGNLTVTSLLNVGEMYDRISASPGRVGSNLGRGLLLVVSVIGALFLITVFMALIAGLALARSITGSVHELFTGTERVRQGDFTHKIAVSSDDQLGELAVSFNSMTASIEDLLRQAAEKKRLEEELRIAHEIQMSLLPQGPLVMAGLSVTALCVPAREVGGDYYDFLPLDDHRLGVLIADVSGKGTSAALYMAELKGLMLSLSEIHSSPRELLVSVNRIIAHHLDARSFITMTYAIIDMRARTMTYARAGHTPLIYVPSPGPGGRSRVKILAPDGLVLGLKIDNGEMFERLLQEETIPLGAGDLYLFFTDGISEAMNQHDDCFGESRLGQLIESHAHLPSDELRERVLREISAFVGDAPQHDDMTMILLKIDEAREAVA
jgi:serine phosphatase RsbU (regulator of sigma subunit)